MKFKEQLNLYMKELGCNAKELSEACGVSQATLSRYRSGNRIPEMDSEVLWQLCKGIEKMSADPEFTGKRLTETEVMECFLQCPDMIATDNESFRRKINELITDMEINVSQLCQHTNYEVSAFFRIRNGSRNPSDPVRLAADIARFVVREKEEAEEIRTLAKLIGCSPEEIADSARRFEHLCNWLIADSERQSDDISRFLEKLDTFDLNEYIKVIHFDELKVPTLPFQFPGTKTYLGLEAMMEGELDFLKATVLSKSQKPVIMYSDMPMEEMAKEADFPKKWMFGMAMMLKKGLQFKMIHNIDRPFGEMMLGLEGWIPMYMTGQVKPYYLKEAQNNVFLHLIKVSGTAALSGEAVAGDHNGGKYYLTKNRAEVAYYTQRAEDLLHHAKPLMEIYRSEKAAKLQAFLQEDSESPGKRRSILPAPPLYVMENEEIREFLAAHQIPEEEQEEIINYAERQRKRVETILEQSEMVDEIAEIPMEEFTQYPAALALSGMYYEKNLVYTYEEYEAHIQKMEKFARKHPNYQIRKTASCAFRNLQIQIHEGKWAMVSKNKSPVIHFVIRHPKLRKAIERFVPPIVEQ